MQSLPMLRKPHHSVGTLTTVDAFECVSDSDSAIDTITEVDSLSDVWSRGTELTEADLDAELNEQDDNAEPDVDALLRSLGMTRYRSEEPLLPPPKNTKSTVTQPPPYCNLFWRQYLASQKQPGKLTAELLAEQNKKFDSRAIPTGREAWPLSNGDWLGYFKAIAGAVPIKHLAGSIVGEDVGSDLAHFMGLGALDTSSDRQASTADTGDVPNGKRVIGSKYVTHVVSMGKGRTGFAFLDEVSIKTPVNSSSHSQCTDIGGDSEASEVDGEEFSGAL